MSHVGHAITLRLGMFTSIEHRVWRRMRTPISVESDVGARGGRRSALQALVRVSVGERCGVRPHRTYRPSSYLYVPHSCIVYERSTHWIREYLGYQRPSRV